jgi:hypothetical protein
LESIVSQTGLNQPIPIKIKIEVDTLPPTGFETEERLLLKPFSFYVKCFALPFLFSANCMLYFQKMEEQCKGRDWLDLEWYIKNKTPLSLEHFIERALASNDLPAGTFTEENSGNCWQKKLTQLILKK